jgi:RNA recognition motif-containing protein
MIDGSARVRTAAGVVHVYGAVASSATTDRDTSRARGFGFVELPDRRAAQDARAGLHGTSGAGRILTVTEAQPRESRRVPRQPRS